MVGNVTDAAGCFVAGTGSATVTVNNPPTAAVLSGTATICSGTSTNLIVTITGGTSPYTVTIDNGVGTINNYVSGTPIPVSPGATTTYNIVGNVTDAAGCTVAGTGSAAVTVNPSPTSAVLSGTATICSGGSTNLIVTITGGTSPYTVTINNGVGTINNYVSGTPIPVSPAATTAYSIVGNVTDASGCGVAGTGTATVTVNNPPASAVLSGTSAICAGGSANLIVTITGGTSPYTITIDNGVGTINNYVSGTPIPVSPAATTTYNMVGNVTDAAGCSVAGSGSATVTVSTGPTGAVLSGTATICSGATTNLIVTITGGTGPYTVTINNGVGTINNYVSGTPIPVSPAATTTYAIVGNVTDAGGCTVAGTGSAVVTVNSPTSAVLSGTATICAGNSTNLIVTITGGTGPYTINIDNGVGVINNYVSGTPIPVNPAATTTYNIVGNVTDANGCTVAGTGSAVVTVNTPPASAVLSGTTAVCAGNSANLIVTITGGTGPYTITIDNGVGTINNYVSGTPIPVSPAATTTYSMVGNVTDAAGCSVAGSGSATVTVSTPPVSAVLTGTATICAGGTTNLIVTITGGTGPYTVTINNGVGTLNNYVSGTPIPVSPAATTTYGIVGNVTDAAGCTVAGTGSATVTVNSPTSAVLSGTAAICAGNSTNLVVTITGGTGPYTINIDNGVGVINNYVSGTPIPVSPAATTTYNMVGNVTDANGCTVAGSGTATVTVNTPPASAVLSGAATICAGGSANLIVTITGGTGPYTINIDNGVGVINNYVSGTPIPVSPAATTTYGMVGNVTDAAGCTVAGTGTATVTVNSPTSAVLSGTASICAGNSANLTVTITGGTGPYTINVDNGVGVINNYVSGTPIPVSPAATTTYNLVGNVTDANGCTVAGTGTATITVTTPPSSAVLSGTATICAGTSTNLIVTITDGTGPFTVTIDNGVGTINNYVSGTPIPVNPTTTTTYSITGNVTDAAGCAVAGTGTAVVTVNPSPTSAVLTGTATICSGNSTNLVVTIAGGASPYTITINNGVGVINNYVSGTPIPVSPAATTSYSLVGNVTDASGCGVAGTGNATVTVNPSPTGTISGTAAICSGSSTSITVNFTGTGPWNFQYSDGTTTSAVIPSFFNSITFSVNPTTTTTYTLVSVNDATSCPGLLNGSAVVTVNQNPAANLPVNVTLDPVCSGGVSGVTVVNAEAGVSYQLRDDSNDNPIGSPQVGTGVSLTLSTGVLTATTTFNILATATGCTPVELSNKATVNVAGTIDAGVAVTVDNTPICSGSSANVLVNSENGVLYQLRNDADDSNVGTAVAGTGGQIQLPTGALTANTTFNVLASNGTCSIELTTLASVQVDVAPDPSLVVTAAPDPLCVGGTAGVTIQGTQAGITYQLRNDFDDSNVGAPVLSTGGDITISTGALTATTTFNVLATSGGACGSVELTTLVTVDVAGTIDATLDVQVATTPICEGSSTDIRVVAAETGITYQLRNNADNSLIGASQVGAGADLLFATGALAASTTFNIIASNATCSIQLTELATVNVDIAPDASINVTAAPSPLCTGGTATITIEDSESGVTYQVRNDFDDSNVGGAVVGTGNDITISTGALTATTTFNVLATGGASCPPVELTDLVTVNVTGTINNTLAVTASAGTICSGGGTFIQIANSEAGVTYQLRNDATNANVGAAVAGTGVAAPISLPTGNLTATTTFNVLASNGICSIELAQTVTVTVNPAPNTTLAVAPAAGLICPNTATFIVVTGAEAGVTYQLRNNVGNVLVGGAVTPAVTGSLSLPTGNLTVSTTFNVFASIGSCSGQLAQIASVTVRPVGDPACGGGGTGDCATVVIRPNPSPATCTLSTGGVTFTINPFVPLVNNEGVIIKIDGQSITNQTISRTQYNDTTFTNLPMGTYTYSIVYGDSSCIKPGTFTIDRSGTVGTPVASDIVRPVCAGSATGSATIDVAGETGNLLEYSFDGITWTPFIAGAPGAVTGIMAGPAPDFERLISVRRNSSDPCNAAVLIQIQDINPAITVDFDLTAATCNTNDGAITNIVATNGSGGPFEFSLDGINFQAQNRFDNLPGGIDTLIVRDGAGCLLERPFNISFPGFVDFEYFVENATCDDNGLSGKITVEIDGAGSNTHTVALGTDQSVEPDASEFQNYPGGPGSSLEFPNLAKGQYFVWVKSATAECPTRSPAININGVQAISFDIAYGCSPGVAPNIDEPYIELNNLVVNETVQFEIHLYKSGIKLPDVIQIGATPGDVRLEFDDYSFLQIPGDDYELEIRQLDLTVFCLVISERVPFIVPRRLSAVIGELKESYPDIPTGYMQVRNFDGGMFPYDIRIELDSASSFELPSFETNFEEVQVNSNSQFEKIYKNIPAGRYLVQVRDTVGCFIEKVVRVPLDTDIFIPNIFTPNDDGSNDVFFIRNLPTPGAKLIVTNRWGKQVFSSNDYQNDWTAEGVADGIYYYKLLGTSGEVVTGWIEVLRGNKP
jgi:gliding motility-associated-like protein